ncbi:hypothetical protein SK128_000005 [Halocaridina rubra]|uniref:Uncharacterized protein n=1 Tax=Halocaridina rubra TaxID=373956 RepID=A0AAN8WYA9_HALRR
MLHKPHPLFPSAHTEAQAPGKVSVSSSCRRAKASVSVHESALKHISIGVFPRKFEMVFKVNERVMAKWPGSTLWFEGVVVDLNDVEYQVRFNDEGQSEYVLRHREVRSYSSFQRSRSRSRGRSNSRGRSAGRQPKKAEYEPEIVAPKVERKVASLNAKIEPKVEVDKVSLKVSDNLGPRTSTPARQSPRIAAMQDSKNAVDGQMNNVNATKGIRDKSIDASGKKADVPARGIVSRIKGGMSCLGSCIKSGIFMLIPSKATVEALLGIVIILALPLVLNRMCTKNKCTVMELPSIPREVKQYYDLTAIAIVGSLLLGVLILSLIPLGRKVNLANGSTLRCNAYPRHIYGSDGCNISAPLRSSSIPIRRFEEPRREQRLLSL